MNVARLITALSLFLAPLSIRAGLVNGSFETNGFSGWEVYECRLLGLYPGAPVTATAWGVDGVVAAMFPIGSALAQSVAVQPGGTYTINFYFACINNDTRSVLGVGVFTLDGKRVALSPPIQDPCGLGADGFNPHSFSFVAPEDVSVIHIRFASYSLGRGSFAVDAVTLDGPPAPAQPCLKISTLMAGKIELRWPVSAVGYALQMTINPGVGAEWLPVDVTGAKRDGQNWSLTMSLGETDHQGLFRLSAAPLPTVGD